MNDQLRQQFDEYIGNLFGAHEDEILRAAQQEAQKNELPAISIQPYEGYLLQWLVRISGARKAVEIGTLAGYSGIWIARALPDDGKLITVEKSAKHAQVAQSNFTHAGVSHKVEIRQGEAQTVLEKLAHEGPFDFVFIDADKAGYTYYLNWAATNLRFGGLVTAHNIYRHGRIFSPESEDDRAMQAFNTALANHPELISMIIPLGDAMAVGQKK